MKKLRIGVFIGGKTIEREASFNSGRTICDHIDISRYEVIPVFQKINGQLYILPWRFLHRGKISDFEHRLDKETKKISWGELKSLVDFVYIASHGHYTEDGTLQAMLEVLKIPYLGSKVLASAISMDKIIQKDILRANNINIPNYAVIYPSDLENIKLNQEILFDLIKEKNINFPCIIKPSKEGSSLGITVVENKKLLLKAIETAATIDYYSVQSVVIEEYIYGLEFSCIIITDYKNKKLIPLPPTEIVLEDKTKFFDYEQKYMPGKATKYTPARCDKNLIKKIQEISVKVTELLEIENLSRIDGFLTKDNKVIITDPNTLSGMAPSSFIFRQASEINLNHTQLINHLIETELFNYNILNKILDNKNLDNISGKYSKNNLLENKNKKLKVAVLLGGSSSEKEISLESGRNIIYKLSPEKYEPIAIFINNNLELYKINQALLVRNSTKEINLGLEPSMKLEWDNLPDIADFVFIGLHGDKGENGCVQGALETLGLPYNGSSVLTSALCINKYKSTEFLKTRGFNVPEHVLVLKDNYKTEELNIIKLIESKINYPAIAKPNNDGCSILVSKVKNKEELKEAINAIFSCGKKSVLVEEFITGIELTVGVIGNNNIKALPPTQAITSSSVLSIEEKFLPGQGENQTPANLDKNTLESIQKTVESAYKALNCKGYARIDCFYQTNQAAQEKIIIIEVNTLPGLTPATCIFHQAAEIELKPMEFIDLIIQLGIEEHKSKFLSSAKLKKSSRINIVNTI